MYTLFFPRKGGPSTFHMYYKVAMLPRKLDAKLLIEVQPRVPPGQFPFAGKAREELTAMSTSHVKIPQKTTGRLRQKMYGKERCESKHPEFIYHQTPEHQQCSHKLSLLNCIQKCQKLGAICQPYYLCQAAIVQVSPDAWALYMNVKDTENISCRTVILEINNSWDENSPHFQFGLNKKMWRSVPNYVQIHMQIRNNRVEDDSDSGYAELTQIFLFPRRVGDLESPAQVLWDQWIRKTEIATHVS